MKKYHDFILESSIEDFPDIRSAFIDHDDSIEVNLYKLKEDIINKYVADKEEKNPDFCLDYIDSFLREKFRYFFHGKTVTFYAMGHHEETIEVTGIIDIFDYQPYVSDTIDYFLIKLVGYDSSTLPEIYNKDFYNEHNAFNVFDGKPMFIRKNGWSKAQAYKDILTKKAQRRFDL